MRSQTLKGFLMAGAAGFCWGSMGVAVQAAMSASGLTALDMVCLRTEIAGVLLALLSLFIARRNVKTLFSHRRLLIDTAVYGVTIFCSHFCFFLSISASSAAVAAVILMVSPLFVILWEAWHTGKPISRPELVSFVLAMAGTALIVTKGRFDFAEMSAAGVLWGLISGVLLAVTVVQPIRALKREGSLVLVGWGMLFSGALSFAIHPFTRIDVEWTPELAALVGYVGVIGTALAFVLYMKSLEFIPPAVTSILVCFEPLSAVILSVLLLGMSFTTAEVIGGLLIFATVFVLFKGSESQKKGKRRGSAKERVPEGDL
ncbi:MAG: EamA family transporter [Burkholderia sp.]|jgi:drug/metabolite transporter (DMT)-like permease